MNFKTSIFFFMLFHWEQRSQAERKISRLSNRFWDKGEGRQQQNEPLGKSRALSRHLAQVKISSFFPWQQSKHPLGSPWQRTMTVKSLLWFIKEGSSKEPVARRGADAGLQHELLPPPRGGVGKWWGNCCRQACITSGDLKPREMPLPQPPHSSRIWGRVSSSGWSSVSS